ncbi:MAG: signal peptide peptidase SppA [Bacteroidota bacterium]|nr:signal peptide peptidase SppA [Bacteroidota bacterium]
MSFGKAFLSSCLGALTAMLVFFFLSIFLISAMVSGLSDDKKVEVSDNSVLHLELDAQVTEMQQENPFAGLPVPGGDVRKVGLLQLKQSIRHAKDDNKIKGIYVEIGQPMAGFSTLEEIRESLIDFRESGKWVVAYNEVMSEGAYYLASAADEVFLNPHGEIEFNGLTVTVGFYKKLFDKWQVKPQIFRVGEFKSAVEPFLLEKMSPENTLQLTELANGIYNTMLAEIGEQRNIETQRLEEISDQMLVRNAQSAVDLGLVDSLLYPDQFTAVLKHKLGLGEDDDIKLVKYNRYRKSFSTYKSSDNEIAVIVAEGTIMPGDGNQNDQVIGGDKFVEEIRKAREDDGIKAIVMRVNSPGGEFRASDMIWREVTLAAKEKPVIASMSDYAASGGYYIAMGADTIVAQPHTITGSIGIFGIMFDLSSFLGNEIGITFDEVRTGNFGDTYTVTRPLSQAEKNYIQKSLDEYYDIFTNKAAEGRDVAQEEILKVASGRVWTGQQALDRKLVDVLGGFDDAIRIAAEKAGVGDDYKVRFYPTPRNFLEELVANLEENAEARTMKNEMGEMYYWYQRARKVLQYQGAQARMPYEFKFE